MGMIDALISLTGLIVGLTFSFADKYVIILTTVLAAVVSSLSMASSNYLANKTGKNEYESLRHPLTKTEKRPTKLTRSSMFFLGLYTGGAYIITSILLILPFIFIRNTMVALGATFVIAILILFAFNFYIGKSNKIPFIKSFFEMFAICVGISVVSFIIAEGAKMFLGINI